MSSRKQPANETTANENEDEVDDYMSDALLNQMQVKIHVFEYIKNKNRFLFRLFIIFVLPVAPV
jgi:hypothetical protein